MIYLLNINDERKRNMQSILHFFTSLGKVFGGYDLGTVDPNLVRYYRTEYGTRWEEELQHHLYNKNKKERS